MELSTFHKGQTVHIVCYFKNNVIPKELYEFSQNIINTRLQRAHKMINKIKDYYKINIDEDFYLKIHVLLQEVICINVFYILILILIILWLNK